MKSSMIFFHIYKLTRGYKEDYGDMVHRLISRCVPIQHGYHHYRLILIVMELFPYL